MQIMVVHLCILYGLPPAPPPPPCLPLFPICGCTAQVDKVHGQKRLAGLEQMQKTLHQKAKHDIGYLCTESSAQSVFKV